MKSSELQKLIREEVHKALRPSSHKLVNESTSEYFTKSLPHAKYKYQYNDTVANGEYKIEVFGYSHKTVADDLHKALLSSGFLEKHPLFKVRVDPMSDYEPI